MARKTYRRKTHRSKSHKRRHSRRQTRKNGGACPCSMRSQFGGRGGLGGADVGHAYTTGATQELKQMGGVSASEKRRRNEARKQRAHNATMKARMEKFKREIVTGNVLPGYEGSEYKHHNNSSRHNKLKQEYLSEWVKMFGNDEGFNGNALIKH